MVFTFALYVFLYLDQEVSYECGDEEDRLPDFSRILQVLTEPTNDLGGRAYRARLAATASRRESRSAQRGVSVAGPLRSNSMSEVGPGPMAGGVPTSRVVPGGAAGPMMSGSRADRSSSRSPKIGGSPGRKTPPSFMGDEEAGSSSGRRVKEERVEDEPSELAGEGYYGFHNHTRA